MLGVSGRAGAEDNVIPVRKHSMISFGVLIVCHENLLIHGVPACMPLTRSLSPLLALSPHHALIRSPFNPLRS